MHLSSLAINYAGYKEGFFICKFLHYPDASGERQRKGVVRGEYMCIGLQNAERCALRKWISSRFKNNVVARAREKLLGGRHFELYPLLRIYTRCYECLHLSRMSIFRTNVWRNRILRDYILIPITKYICVFFSVIRYANTQNVYGEFLVILK